MEFAAGITDGPAEDERPFWEQNLDHNFPTMLSILDGPLGPQMRSEISLLIGKRWIDRAPRKRAIAIANITDGAATAKVSLRDVSKSGVRLHMRRRSDFRVAPDQPLWLQLMISVGGTRVLHEFPVILVRVVERRGFDLDLAFRFDGVPENKLKLLDHIDNVTC